MILGLDIGGANLKASDGSSWSESIVLPLWSDFDALQPTLGRLVKHRLPQAIAVTMSGELADCFTSKADGVDRILAAVEAAAGDRPVVVWQTAGEFVPVVVAREFWMLTAAANWHAQATWAARCHPHGSALLLDVGTTTTDLIPIQNGFVAATGRTDFDRLSSGELLYEGLGRTPLACLDTDGPGIPAMAAEVFATTGDAWVVFRNDPAVWSGPTADGRDCGVAASRHRIARQFCSDENELPSGLIDDVVRRVCEGQVERIFAAAAALIGDDGAALILSGSGGPVAAAVAAELTRQGRITETVVLADLLSPAAASAGCAYAVATLAGERLHLP